MKTLISHLQTRFENNMHRHPQIQWHDIEAKIIANENLQKTVQWMEETGGEPDVTLFEDKLVFTDFSKESPIKRRSICYDEKARLKRKKNRPEASIESLIQDNGAQILNEKQYRSIQKLEAIDEKSSSWILTPQDLRALGAALFCERRYNRVFVFHNSAQSYYASRAVRVYIEII